MSWLAFVAASLALIAIPGPNVGLIVGNSLTHGRRMGLVTVAGTSTANALQLALTVAGLAQIIAVLAHGFEILRWAGVAYLVLLAVLAFLEKPADVKLQVQAADIRTVFARALLVGVTNPKTLLFYSAFLPQFVDHARPAGPQLALLAATFMVLAVLGDSLWAVLADRARGVMAKAGRLRSRITGVVYLIAGLGLAGARAG